MTETGNEDGLSKCCRCERRSLWLALPKSSSRNAHGGVTAGGGGDGKGEERKTLSLISSFPSHPSLQKVEVVGDDWGRVSQFGANCIIYSEVWFYTNTLFFLNRRLRNVRSKSRGHVVRGD